MNTNLARENMVYNDIRPLYVFDEKVLQAIKKIPRERFLPDEYKKIAYVDYAIPLGYNQETLEPNIIGRICQRIKCSKEDNVLEIGTGSGYLTAILATLSKKVISIEIIKDLANKASENLKKLNYRNVELIAADAFSYKFDRKFDVIVFTGSIDFVPDEFKEMLNINGRIFAVTGYAPAMNAKIITKTSKSNFSEVKIFETVIPRLINAPELSKFEF